jgi:hypothetical protein
MPLTVEPLAEASRLDLRARKEGGSRPPPLEQLDRRTCQPAIGVAGKEITSVVPSTSIVDVPVLRLYMM